jgi:hypothetical protein
MELKLGARGGLYCTNLSNKAWLGWMVAMGNGF